MLVALFVLLGNSIHLILVFLFSEVIGGCFTKANEYLSVYSRKLELKVLSNINKKENEVYDEDDSDTEEDLDGENDKEFDYE